MSEEEAKKEAEDRYREMFGTDYKNDKWTQEDTLKTVAGFILVLGIIATIICIFALVYPKVDVGYTVYGHHYSDYKREFSATGLATTLTILFTSVISWAVMRVIAEISSTLKEINKKIK